MRLRLVGPVLLSLALTGCAVAPISAPSSTPSAVGSTASKPTVPTDIDGDGLGDSLSLKHTNGHWTLTVVTASGSSVFTNTDWDLAGEEPEPVGLAPLNPVAGSEVIFRDLFSDDFVYQVLTWRDGHLVEVQNPAGTSNRWAVADEFNVNTGYAFSEKDGQPQLVTYQTDGNISGPVSFVEYAWISDAWAGQRNWTEEFSAEQSSSLCIGLCGVTLTPLPGQ